MFTKFRFKIELYIFYLKKNFLFILLGLSIGYIAVIYQDKIHYYYQKMNTPTIKVGIEGMFTYANLPLSITNQISYGLTQVTQNNKTIISPIVKELSINQEKNSYEFKINTNYLWHDGKPLSSQNIKYNISGVTFPYPSPDTLVINIDKAFSPLESTFTKPIFKKDLVGLGSYQVKGVQFKDGYINYLKLVSKELPTIIYRFYQNQNDLISAFKIGEVNQINLNEVPVSLESGWKVNINKNISTNTQYAAIFFNTQILTSKQLRQALAYATPKSTNKNDRCLSPIASTSWAYNPSVKDYAFNPTRARELFEKNKIKSINLSVGDRSLLSTAENIKKSWEEILKIQVNLTVGQINTNDFDAIIHYGSIPVDPDQYIFWHSTQSKTNITKINNPKIDKLLEDGRSTFDTLERKKIYQEFQKVLLEESPVIFLSYPTVYNVTRVK
jgi:peptide/nickel transport system substrate-binding protein